MIYEIELNCKTQKVKFAIECDSEEGIYYDRPEIIDAVLLVKQLAQVITGSDGEKVDVKTQQTTTNFSEKSIDKEQPDYTK